MALHQAGDLAGAIPLYRQIILISPTCAEAYCNMGAALLDLEQPAKALEAFKQASDLDPHNPDIYNNLGIAYYGTEEFDQAIAACKRAIALRPDSPQALNTLGSIYFRLGQLDQAITACKQALTLKPDYPDALLSLSNALREHGDFDGAFAASLKGITLRPGDARAHNNLGNLLKDTGQIEKAREAYEYAVSLKPNYALVHLNLAHTLLQMGHLREGWAEFEWRWKVEKFARQRMSFPQPEWAGQPLNGKTILLYSEQGHGDSLQLVRFAPILAAMGAKVLLGVFAPLARLFASVAGVSAVMKPGEPIPPFDYHLSMMSLPHVMGITLDNIPADVPYLHAEPVAAALWRDRLAALPGLKVGLVWSGDPRPHDYEANMADRRRSLRLEQFAGLADIPGVSLVNLQMGAPAEQIKNAAGGLHLHDFMGEVQDFADTAALIANLDLVITVDTAAAHLAGAMGKPVWILSRFDGCWRWLLEREDSPWYPTARLFRQTRPGDWSVPLQSVAAALRGLAGEPLLQ